MKNSQNNDFNFLIIDEKDNTILNVELYDSVIKLKNSFGCYIELKRPYARFEGMRMIDTLFKLGYNSIINSINGYILSPTNLINALKSNDLTSYLNYKLQIHNKLPYLRLSNKRKDPKLYWYIGSNNRPYCFEDSNFNTGDIIPSAVKHEFIKQLLQVWHGDKEFL